MSEQLQAIVTVLSLVNPAICAACHVLCDPAPVTVQWQIARWFCTRYRNTFHGFECHRHGRSIHTHRNQVVHGLSVPYS